MLPLLSMIYKSQNIVEMQLNIWLIWHSGIYFRCNTASMISESNIIKLLGDEPEVFCLKILMS